MSALSLTRPRAARPELLAAGFLAAVALRAAVGDARSATAGLVFAGCLALLVRLAPPVTRLDRRALAAGVAGALVLLVPVVLTRGWPHAGGPGFADWALVVAVVALAEEALLRGALHDAVTTRHGDLAAVAVGAVLFAVLHLPLYGWRVLPLDLAVGLGLGELRRVAGTWTAPGLAHVLADLGSWFLR